MPRSHQPRPRRPSTPPVILPKPSPPVVVHPPTPEKPGFGQLIKEGIGFGAGQAIAHRAVNAILGPTIVATQQSAQTPETSKCSTERKAFEVCLKTKTQEDQCNNEFLAFTQCVQLN